MKSTIDTQYIRYNKLNIHQKINVKANAVTANTHWEIDLCGWIPMDKALADFGHTYKEYSSPYNRTLSFNFINR